jgi:predicted transcriptional regulator
MTAQSMTITLEPSLRQRLVDLAQATQRDETTLIEEALIHFLDLQEWQRQRIEQGLAAADRGEFASDDDLARILGKYEPKSS